MTQEQWDTLVVVCPFKIEICNFMISLMSADSYAYCFSYTSFLLAAAETFEYEHLNIQLSEEENERYVVTVIIFDGIIILKIEAVFNNNKFIGLIPYDYCPKLSFIGLQRIEICNIKDSMTPLYFPSNKSLGIFNAIHISLLNISLTKDPTNKYCRLAFAYPFLILQKFDLINAMNTYINIIEKMFANIMMYLMINYINHQSTISYFIV